MACLPDQPAGSLQSVLLTALHCPTFAAGQLLAGGAGRVPEQRLAGASLQLSDPCPPCWTALQVNYWLGGLMEVKSNDLYRMKGVLAIKDFPARFVFQG